MFFFKVDITDFLDLESTYLEVKVHVDTRLKRTIFDLNPQVS